jgi:hypothetical protein
MPTILRINGFDFYFSRATVTNPRMFMYREGMEELNFGFLELN